MPFSALETRSLKPRLEVPKAENAWSRSDPQTPVLLHAGRRRNTRAGQPPSKSHHRSSRPKNSSGLITLRLFLRDILSHHHSFHHRGRSFPLATSQEHYCRLNRVIPFAPGTRRQPTKFSGDLTLQPRSRIQSRHTELRSRPRSLMLLSSLTET